LGDGGKKKRKAERKPAIDLMKFGKSHGPGSGRKKTSGKLEGLKDPIRTWT